MEIPIKDERFEGQELVVKTAGFFKGPHLLLNGNPLKGKRGRYSVRNKADNEISVTLKYNWFDPIPKVKIEDKEIELARPIKWYEYIWMGLPIILVFLGGVLGAGIGIFATWSSARIFRSDRGICSKYILSAIISIIAVIVFFILAGFLQVLIKGVPK